MTILVTGGAGFIGANFVLDWLDHHGEPVATLDKLTYAGHRESLAAVLGDARHTLVVGDIGDTACVAAVLRDHRPRAVVHFAAESHVDRSITGPEAFIETNIVGTFRLLEAVRGYWQDLPPADQAAFRFLHVSTDEVYGSLTPDAPAFREADRYAPNSPYSASKAGSDHMVRAYHHTYGLPVLTTHCSNNYGPYQYPEKLIPLMIHRALTHQPLPVYGDGLHVRDWLYVTDHCHALRIVLQRGQVGGVYNIGGLNEHTNRDLVHLLCDLLQDRRPIPDDAGVCQYRDLITSVPDRLGHDRRYAINASRIESDLGWRPVETFRTGLARTVDWYLDHPDWVQAVLAKMTLKKMQT